jgi:hypothetical protein
MARWIEPQRSVRTARQAAITALVVRALLCLAVIPATGVVAGAAASLTPAFGSVSLRAPAPTAGVLKYYIVGPPVNGRAEYLDIAGRRGNGTAIDFSQPELYQPDGGQLVDLASCTGMIRSCYLTIGTRCFGSATHDAPADCSLRDREAGEPHRRTASAETPVPGRVWPASSS